MVIGSFFIPRRTGVYINSIKQFKFVPNVEELTPKEIGGQVNEFIAESTHRHGH